MTSALVSQSFHSGTLSTSRRGLTCKDKEESRKKMHYHLDQSVISINRAFVPLHTKLTRISASSITHTHAFTCTYRYCSLFKESGPLHRCPDQ